MAMEEGMEVSRLMASDDAQELEFATAKAQRIAGRRRMWLTVAAAIGGVCLVAAASAALAWTQRSGRSVASSSPRTLRHGPSLQSGVAPARLPSVIEEVQGCKKTCDDFAHYSENSFTSATGLKQLYFTVRGEPSLGQHNRASKTILVFHGVGVNPHRYLCYAYNGFKKVGGSTDDVYMVSVAMASYVKVHESSRRRRRGLTKGKVLYWGWNSSDPDTIGSKNWMFGLDSKLPNTGAVDSANRSHDAADDDDDDDDDDDADSDDNDDDDDDDDWQDDAASSFTVLDDMIKTLSDKSIYPNMQEVLLIGHGGGGQFVQRYSVLNTVDPQPGMWIRYVVANPSTYLYLTPERPVLYNVESKSDVKSIPCSRYDPHEIHSRKFAFAAPNLTVVKHYVDTAPSDRLSPGWGEVVNDYPFGLDHAPAYVQSGVSTIKEKFIQRNVIYLSAYYDCCNYHLQKGAQCGWCCKKPQENNTDDCEIEHHELKYPLSQFTAAYAQGLTRVARAYGYWAHIGHVYGHHGNHEFHRVNGKHSSCEIFQTESVAQKLFLPSGHA